MRDNNNINCCPTLIMSRSCHLLLRDQWYASYLSPVPHTTNLWALCAARNNGVWPQASSTLTKAPAASNTKAQSQCPKYAAWCNGVLPNLMTDAVRVKRSSPSACVYFIDITDQPCLFVSCLTDQVAGWPINWHTAIWLYNQQSDQPTKQLTAGKSTATYLELQYW